MTNTTTTNTPSTANPATRQTPIDLADPTSVVDAWLVAYAQSDLAQRRQSIQQIWAADGTLIDPPFDGAGHEALSGMVDVVLTHYAGHTFRRTTRVDLHHGYARYGWELVGPDGAVAVGGTDIARFGDDGKLTQVVGFFGALDADVA